MSHDSRSLADCFLPLASGSPWSQSCALHSVTPLSPPSRRTSGRANRISVGTAPSHHWLSFRFSAPSTCSAGISLLSIAVRGTPTGLPESSHEHFLPTLSSPASFLAFSTSHAAMQFTAPSSHALPRTAPCVTLAASSLRLSPTVQPARRAPQSLSFGSSGALASLTSNDTAS